MKFLSRLIKFSLGGGVVYVAVDQGLFSSSQKETIESTQKITDSVPGLDSYTKKLSVGLSKDQMICYWNSGVKAVISALADLPADSKELACKGYNYLKTELQNQMKAEKK